jgi:4-diphosphocytidyl-2C-methyl-D-erythritol kinase
LGQDVSHALCGDTSLAVDDCLKIAYEVGADLEDIVKGERVLAEAGGDVLEAIEGAVADTSLHVEY